MGTGKRFFRVLCAWSSFTKTPEILDDSDFATDFATPGRMYILTFSIKTYSDMGIKNLLYYDIFFKNSYRGKGVENKMTDNLKVKASKAVDDTRVAAHAVYDDATVATHTTLKNAGVEAQKLSGDVKIGVHKAVSDAKIAVHEAGSALKKAEI
jgi:hypothetical protein